MKLSNNKILVTGGATGIGFALAERFMQEGNTVLICGRRESTLADAAKKLPGLITKTCDLSVYTERVALYRWIEKEHSDLNVLVNNAGIQQWMSITDANFYQRAKEEISINIEAPVHLTQLFLELDSLHTVINVTSGLSFVPLSKTPVYSGTKAFLHSFTLSLRHLLIPRGIEVIEMVPPALNTDLGGKGIHDAAPPVAGFITSIFEQLKEGKPQLTYGFSEQMVKAGPEEQRNAFSRLNEQN